MAGERSSFSLPFDALCAVQKCRNGRAESQPVVQTTPGRCTSSDLRTSSTDHHSDSVEVLPQRAIPVHLSSETTCSCMGPEPYHSPRDMPTESLSDSTAHSVHSLTVSTAAIVDVAGHIRTLQAASTTPLLSQRHPPFTPTLFQLVDNARPAARTPSGGVGSRPVRFTIRIQHRSHNTSDDRTYRLLR